MAAPCARTGSCRGSWPRGCRARTSTTATASAPGSPSATRARSAVTSSPPMTPITRSSGRGGALLAPRWVRLCTYDLGFAWRWYVLAAIPWKLSEKPHSLTAQLGLLELTSVILLWFSSVGVAVLHWELDGKNNGWLLG
jgi:hypothetical protein